MPKATICDNGGTQPYAYTHARSPMKANNVSLANKFKSPAQIRMFRR